MKTAFAFSFAAVSLLAIQTAARADLNGPETPEYYIKLVGPEYIPGDSWSKQWVAGGGFDLLAFKISTPPGVFETPGLTVYSDSGYSIPLAGWSGKTAGNITYIEGPQTSTIYWELHFAEPPDRTTWTPANPLRIEEVLFHNNQPAPWLYYYWTYDTTNGWAWGTPTPWNPTRAELQAIPAPGAIVLGLMGLGAVGVWMRRYA